MEPDLVAVAAVSLVAWGGSRLMGDAAKGGWYRCVQPPLAPPPWAFPVAWGVLYALIAVALARALRAPDPTLHRLFAANLALNLLWTPLFFRWRRPGASLGVIAAMLWTLAKIDDRARHLRFCVVPYAAWLAFAGYLNAEALARAGGCEGAGAAR